MGRKEIIYYLLNSRLQYYRTALWLVSFCLHLFLNSLGSLFLSRVLGLGRRLLGQAMPCHTSSRLRERLVVCTTDHFVQGSSALCAWRANSSAYWCGDGRIWPLWLAYRLCTSSPTPSLEVVRLWYGENQLYFWFHSIKSGILYRELPVWQHNSRYRLLKRDHLRARITKGIQEVSLRLVDQSHAGAPYTSDITWSCIFDYQNFQHFCWPFVRVFLSLYVDTGSSWLMMDDGSHCILKGRPWYAPLAYSPWIFGNHDCHGWNCGSWDCKSSIEVFTLFGARHN